MARMTFSASSVASGSSIVEATTCEGVPHTELCSSVPIRFGLPGTSGDSGSGSCRRPRMCWRRGRGCQYHRILAAASVVAQAASHRATSYPPSADRSGGNRLATSCHLLLPS